MKKIFTLCVLAILLLSCLILSLSACKASNTPGESNSEKISDSLSDPNAESQSKPEQSESEYTLELLEKIANMKGGTEERILAIAKILPPTHYKYKISDVSIQTEPLRLTIEERYDDSIADSWSYWEMYAQSKLENNLMLLFNSIKELDTVYYKSIGEEADKENPPSVYRRTDIESIFGKTPREMSINELHTMLSDNMLPDDSVGEAIARNRIRPGDTLAYVEMRIGKAGERESIENGGFKISYNNYENIGDMCFWYKDSLSKTENDAVLKMSGYISFYPLDEIYEKWGEPYVKKDRADGGYVLVYRLKNKERFMYFVVDENNDSGASVKTVSMEGLVDELEYLYSLVN